MAKNSKPTRNGGTKVSKGKGMDQAITPDKQELMGRSGMPHPPYKTGQTKRMGG